jgi:hypothetical protein
MASRVAASGTVTHIGSGRVLLVSAMVRSSLCDVAAPARIKLKEREVLGT